MKFGVSRGVQCLMVVLMSMGCGPSEQKSIEKEVKVDVCGPLIAKLADSEADAVTSALDALFEKREECFEAVKLAAGHENEQVQVKALELLGRIGNPKAASALATAMQQEDVKIRTAAANSMKAFKYSQVSGALSELMEVEDFKVRVMAVGILREMKDADSIPLLIRSLMDKHGGVRNGVYEVIALIGKPAVERLLTEYASSTSEADKRMLIVALGRTRDPSVVDTLVQVVQGDEIRLRNAAACALADITDPRTVEPLLAALEDQNAPVRACSAKALGNQGDNRAVMPLMKLLQSDSFDHVKAMAAYGLGKLADPRSIPVLIKALKEPTRSVRYHSVAALSNFQNPQVVGPLASMLSDEEVRTHAVASLVKVGPISSQAMIKALRSNDSNVAAAAATVLGRLGDKSAIRSLVGVLGKSDPTLQQQVSTALRMLSGQNFGTDVDAWNKWMRENA